MFHMQENSRATFNANHVRLTFRKDVSLRRSLLSSQNRYIRVILREAGSKAAEEVGVLFSCLSSRVVHIEVCDSLETSSAINALRRF